jgi:hypothetical protein
MLVTALERFTGEFVRYLNPWIEDSIRKNGTDKPGTIVVDFPATSLVEAITARYS